MRARAPAPAFYTRDSCKTILGTASALAGSECRCLSLSLSRSSVRVVLIYARHKSKRHSVIQRRLLRAGRRRDGKAKVEWNVSLSTVRYLMRRRNNESSTRATIRYFSRFIFVASAQRSRVQRREEGSAGFHGKAARRAQRREQKEKRSRHEGEADKLVGTIKSAGGISGLKYYARTFPLTFTSATNI